MKKIFIYPNKNQINEIEKLFLDAIVITKENAFSINLSSINGKAKDYKIICCNEEALYYAKSFISESVNMDFNKECLELYDKKKSDILFEKYNIPHIKKSNTPISFPTIAKPNFGFASIGVEELEDREQFAKYTEKINDIIENSPVGALKNLYFKNLTIEPVYERKINDGYFYSVPFIYDKNDDDVIIFPIKGINKIKNNYSNFFWKTFLYDEQHINKDIYNLIKKELLNLSHNLLINTSVNMAEIFYDIETDKVLIVEFSPRIPGGKLSDLIYCGCGIDLNLLSIKFQTDSIVDIKKICKPVILDICTNINKLPLKYIKTEKTYSKIFNQNIVYVISTYQYKNIGLIPGRFAPLHKGHQIMFDKAKKEMDEVIILIFNTNDINVPLNVRADWIRKLYPEFIVVEGKNCPDGKKYAYELGQKCAYYQNKYIKNIIQQYNITHLYHSVTYGKSVSKALDAVEIMVDLDRNQIPISGTMIRNNCEMYKDYLDEYVYKEYKKYIEKEKK